MVYPQNVAKQNPKSRCSKKCTARESYAYNSLTSSWRRALRLEYAINCNIFLSSGLASWSASRKVTLKQQHVKASHVRDTCLNRPAPVVSDQTSLRRRATRSAFALDVKIIVDIGRYNKVIVSMSLYMCFLTIF